MAETIKIRKVLYFKDIPIADIIIEGKEWEVTPRRLKWGLCEIEYGHRVVLEGLDDNPNKLSYKFEGEPPFIKSGQIETGYSLREKFE